MGRNEKNETIFRLQLLGALLCRIWAWCGAGSICFPETGAHFSRIFADCIGNPNLIVIKKKLENQTALPSRSQEGDFIYENCRIKKPETDYALFAFLL